MDAKRKGAVRETPMGDLHVVPNSEPEHVPDRDCYCCPRLDYQDPETGRRVWVHTEREQAN